MESTEAEAVWTSGGRSFPVKVLSGPDVQGMVEVGFLWSGQRDRVRQGCLSDLNPAAEKLFALVDRFVSVPARAVPGKPAAPPRKEKPARLPGAPIEYDRAAFLFPGIHKCHIPPTAKLTLLGHADGRVALRAYDRDQHLLGELFYEPAARVKAPPKPAASTGSKPPPPGNPSGLTKAELYEVIHPDLGRIADVRFAHRTTERLGSLVKARGMVYSARRDSQPVPAPFVFGLPIVSPELGPLRLLVLYRVFDDRHAVYCMLDPSELEIPNAVWSRSPCPEKSPCSPSSASSTAPAKTTPTSSAVSSPSPSVPSRRSGTLLM